MSEDVDVIFEEGDQKREVARVRDSGLKLGFCDLSAAELAAIDTDKLREILTMKRELESDAERKAFYEALAAFQSSCPRIERNTPVVVKGQKVFDYAKYEAIKAQIQPLLRKHGFSTRLTQSVEGSRVVVTLTLSRGGWSEPTTYSIDVSAPSSRMSTPSMEMVKATTMAKRNALLLALDIACEDEDAHGYDDGPPELITREQADELLELLDQVDPKSGQRARFLDWLEVEGVDQIPAAKLEQARKALTRILSKQNDL